MIVVGLSTNQYIQKITNTAVNSITIFLISLSVLYHKHNLTFIKKPVTFNLVLAEGKTQATTSYEVRGFFVGKNMNETIKRFFQENTRWLITTFVTACLIIIGSYVSLQLFEQQTSFRIEATDRRVANLETNLSDRPQKQQEFRVLQSQVATVIKNQEVQDKKLDTITNYLLEHK